MAKNYFNEDEMKLFFLVGQYLAFAEIEDSSNSFKKFA